MRARRTAVLTLAATTLAMLGSQSAMASHHLMQIHEVIGGVDGDAMAQAVQLRMRGGSQHRLQNGKLWAFDANGDNPVLLIDFDAPVVNHGAGVTVLVVTANFVNQTSPECVPDYVMNPIPESYLAAGSLTFENNAGTNIWWRLSWGGSNYTGPTTGSLTNDDDGEFGVWPDPLPSTSLQALLYQGAPTDRSTTNQDDYEVTPGAAVFTNNDGDSFTVVGAPTGICADNGTILAGIESSGDFVDACASDDNRWVVQSTTFAAAFSPAPVAIEFEGTINPLGAGANLTFRMEGQPQFGNGAAFIQLRMFNYTTQTFQGMPFINQPDGADIVYEFTVDNSNGDYIDGNGNVRAQVTFAKTLDGPIRGHIDQVVWLVN